MLSDLPKKHYFCFLQEHELIQNCDKGTFRRLDLLYSVQVYPHGKPILFQTVRGSVSKTHMYSIVLHFLCPVKKSQMCTDILNMKIWHQFSIVSPHKSMTQRCIEIAATVNCDELREGYIQEDTLQILKNE